MYSQFVPYIFWAVILAGTNHYVIRILILFLMVQVMFS